MRDINPLSFLACLYTQCFSKNWNSSAAKDIFQRGANLDPKCWVRTNIQISIYTSSSRAEHMNNGPKKGRNSENHHHNLKIGRDRGWSTWESKIDSSIQFFPILMYMKNLYYRESILHFISGEYCSLSERAEVFYLLLPLFKRKKRVQDLCFRHDLMWKAETHHIHYYVVSMYSSAYFNT